MIAKDFLELLFGHPSLAGLYIPLWFKWRDKPPEHQTWAIDRLEDAADAAMAASPRGDVYVRTTPIGFKPTGNARGDEEHAAALVAFFADIDILGPGHKRSDIPPNEVAAFDLLHECAKPPTVVVHSGGGLHAWWVFERPFLITDQATLAEAMAMSRGWNVHVQGRAAKHGWHVDQVGDLARVLRIPETMNHKNKSEPKHVKVMAQ